MPPPDEIRSEPSQPPHSLHDAQIDPALLEAVVAALQHVEPQDPTSSNSQTTTDIPQNQASSSTQPATQTSNEGEPRTTRPRRKRATRKTNEGDAGEEGEEDDDDTPLSSKSTNKKPTPKKKRVPRKRARSTQSEQTDADAEGEYEDEGNESSSSRTKKRSRKNSTTSSTNGNGTRKRKAKAPSPLPYDAEADPGEEIDPTAVTMASLCDDTGRGRVSSKAAQILNNHAAWKASNKEKRARMRAIMEAKKYGRDLEAEEERAEGSGVGTSAMKENQAEGSSGNGEEQNGGPSTLGLDEEEPRKDDEFDYSQTVATSGFNVQVRIGPNGETIIDEHSLFVDRNGEDDTAHYTHVEESDATKFVNSGSYSKKLRGSRWSAEETELFFDALSQFGENYELISYVLPGRDRKACKNKFKAEDKKNPGRITQCLKERRPYDIQTLSRMTGKDFSGPTPEIRTPTPVVHPPPEEQHTAQTAAAPSTAPPKKRKKQAKQDDGVEILGDISDIEKEDFEFPNTIS
ncbi:hypothetical protein C8Q75DRAFT_723380 [Abortiporus biennis]|nr:hypothetical protein C8Q75DRAFT_723380 [Abortiporus biennis]